MNDRLKALADAGVSIWLDDLSRERLETGNLADLVRDDHVVGVTSNPSIFQAALADGERYDAQVRDLAAEGADVDRATMVIPPRTRSRRPPSSGRPSASRTCSSRSPARRRAGRRSPRRSPPASRST
jgi:hypothetical protein